MTDTLAIFENNTGKRTAIIKTVLGGYYIERLDYTGMFAAGATTDCDHTMLGLLSDTELYKIVKSPKTLYHSWHICLCEKCRKIGGRYFDHSQASWNDHLKYCENNDIFTFKSLE